MSSRRGAAFAAGVLTTLVTLAGARLPALEGPAWSGDGRTLVGLACVEGKPSLVALAAADGLLRWSAELGKIVRRCEGIERAEWVVRPAWSGDAAILSDGSHRYWLRTGQAGPSALAFGKGQVLHPTPAPDASAVAFLREGDLWALPTGGGALKRLTEGAGITSRQDPHGGAETFQWSPDSRSIAFRTPTRIGVVDLLAPSPRLLELEQTGAVDLRSFRWRYDGRAVVVVSRDLEGAEEHLSLCHPEKLYCRTLATRLPLGDEAPENDVVFFEDGVLWAERAPDGAIRLAWHDTLGRRRSAVDFAGASVVRVESVDFEAHRLVVSTRSGGSLAWKEVELGAAEPIRDLAWARGLPLGFSPGQPAAFLASDKASRARAVALVDLLGRKLADLPGISR